MSWEGFYTSVYVLGLGVCSLLIPSYSCGASGPPCGESPSSANSSSVEADVSALGMLPAVAARPSRLVSIVTFGRRGSLMVRSGDGGPLSSISGSAAL